MSDTVALALIALIPPLLINAGLFLAAYLKTVEAANHAREAAEKAKIAAAILVKKLDGGDEL